MIYSLQDDAEETAELIIRLYNGAIKDANAEIQAIARSFERLTGKSIEEALSIDRDGGNPSVRSTITAAQEEENIKKLYALYDLAEDGSAEKDEIALKINTRAYSARIDTQELIKDTIYTAIKAVSIESKTRQTALYDKVYRSAYYTSIFNAAKGADIGVSFSVLPQQAIDAALNENWSGRNYSERIWGRSDDFVSAVQETVINGLMTGKSQDARAQMLADRLGIEVDYNVRRLVRTETAHFTNQGQLKAYRDAGFTEYRYLAALSSATCEVCADLDGQIFKVADAREGENYPPIHPNCRCTTIIADFTSGTRSARDPLTGKSYTTDAGTFKEWYAGLSDEQWAVMKNYVDKSQKSDTIELYRKGDTFRKTADDGHKIIDKATYNKITKPAIKKGADIRIAEGKILERLKNKKATAVTYGDVIYFKEDATVSDVLEEVHHFYQNKNKLNSQYANYQRGILNEIDAKEYLISVEEKYHIPEEEMTLTRKQLENYKNMMQGMKERGEWDD